MTKPIRTLVKVIRNLFFVPDLYWAARIPFRSNPRNFSLDRSSQRLFVKKLGIYLTKGRHDFLIEAFEWLAGLQDRFGASVTIEESGDVIVAIDGVKVLVADIWDIGTVREIFADHIYNFRVTDPVVVLDIGMNIGVASLFFAAMPDVQAVFSYEPFKQTYNQALRNLDLNPGLKTKIKPQGYGIDGVSRSLTADFDTASKVDNSTHNFAVKNEYRKASQHIVPETVEVMGIVSELDRIRTLYPDTELIGKIDCEGAEYDIFEALHAADRLREFSLLMIEWHVLGPDKLIDYLRQAGFQVFSFGLFRRTDVGTLYAFRR